MSLFFAVSEMALFSVQIMEDEPFELLKPTLEGLLKDVDYNKQRAAAELLAGLLGGMKHWPTHAQGRVWEWLIPFMDKVLGSSVKSDTLTVWTSFLSVSLPIFKS